MPLSAAHQLLGKEIALVEEKLIELSKNSPVHLTELLQYILQQPGKRLRPILTLLSGKVGNAAENADLLITMATAVELLHTATLVHDDTLDNSDTRRGRITINSKWGNSTAILLGDYLFAKSAYLVSTTNNIRVMRLFAQTLMSISNGELQQQFYAFRTDLTKEQYFDRIGQKTASLFSMATESGAILSDMPEASIQALKDYGYNLGIAFQIVDDIFDFTANEVTLGKPIGSDLLQGTLTLPSFLLLERSPNNNPVEKLFKNRADTSNLMLCIEMIMNSDIIQECYRIATTFCNQATHTLEILPRNTAYKSLFDIAQYTLQRIK